MELLPQPPFWLIRLMIVADTFVRTSGLRLFFVFEIDGELPLAIPAYSPKSLGLPCHEFTKVVNPFVMRRAQ